MILGISGKIGTGKTTLAGYLVQMLGPKWVRMSVGDELKKEVASKFGIPLADMYTQEGKRKVVSAPGVHPETTLRELLQWYGQLKRDQDPEYWVKALAHNMPDGKHVIVDDVRRRNELEFVQKYGDVVRVEPFRGWRQVHVVGGALEIEIMSAFI